MDELMTNALQGLIAAGPATTLLLWVYLQERKDRQAKEGKLDAANEKLAVMAKERREELKELLKGIVDHD